MATGLSRMSARGKIAAAAGVIVIAVVVVAVISATGSAGQQRALLKASSFSLHELGHPGTVSLAALAGRPVIINFFASWCAPCQRETPLIARFYDEHHGQVAIIGIDSNDHAGSALRFLHQAGVRYPVGFDPYPASTTTSYGVLALPQTFFLNSQHRIVRHLFGAVTMHQLTAGAAAIGGRPAAALGAAAPAQDRG